MYMKYDRLLQLVGDLPWFDFATVLQLLGESRQNLRVRLYEWRKAGKLLSLRRGMYALAAPYRRMAVHPALLSNQLYTPSYISMHWALSYYGMIPEKTVVYTAVTPRVGRSFENSFGVYRYSNLKRDMTFAGFDIALNWNDCKTVHTAWIKVAGLLKDAGLSAMANENLSIKLKIDSCPPAGAESVRTVINRHLMFAVRHHSLPSLMAGKIHALVTRKYSKGRDWYDLLWYLSHRPPTEPNLVLLQNALDQTQGVGIVQAVDWRDMLSEKAQGMDFPQLLQDVEPFLERPQDAGLLTQAHFKELLTA